MPKLQIRKVIRNLNLDSKTKRIGKVLVIAPRISMVSLLLHETENTI